MLAVLQVFGSMVKSQQKMKKLFSIQMHLLKLLARMHVQVGLLDVSLTQVVFQAHKFLEM